tara:strand:- start:73 stop:549 length:477 start_codon:yes stop_codon:yes gene_type:complete
MYFSGSNIEVFVFHPAPTKQLDVVDLQFTVNQTSSPIYSYAATRSDDVGNKIQEHEYSTVMRGTSLVQGTMVLNFSSDSNEDFYSSIMDAELEILINMRYTEFDRDTNTSNSYSINDQAQGYILSNVHIISRNQTINSSPENIVEAFHFVAKSFEQFT